VSGVGKDPAAATSPAVFLEHQSYRRRRLMDGARLLPLLGAGLFAVPLLWPKAKIAGESDGLVAMSDAITYVFVVWGALIGVSALFGFGVRYWARPDTSSETRQD
jgi:hypothetical protein